jgi:hypothetical protein
MAVAHQTTGDGNTSCGMPVQAWATRGLVSRDPDPLAQAHGMHALVVGDAVVYRHRPPSSVRHGCCGALAAPLLSSHPY